MPFNLLFQELPIEQLEEIERTNPKKHRKVLKCFAYLENIPRHPGLNSHRYEDYDDVHGEKIWESYVESNTPGAYRVFWHYGPDDGEITIIAITPHP